MKYQIRQLPAEAGEAVLRTIRLGRIAHARSGDKGSSANLGVIAYTPAGYEVLRTRLTPAVVQEYFRSLGPREVVRYELPNLRALNFVLQGILAPGGSMSLRVDAQGKVLGQAVLLMPIEVPEDLLPQCLRRGSAK
jgi:hypothetical protein